MSTHTPGPWVIGKSGRLQTKPNAAGGCTVIIDESIRFNPDRDLLIKAPIAPKLAEALRALYNLTDGKRNDKVVFASIRNDARAALAEWDAQS